MRRILLPIVLTILLIMAAACGGGETPPPNPARDSTADREDSSSSEILDEADSAEMEEDAAEGEAEDEAPSGAVLQKLTITGSPRYGEAVETELQHGEIPDGMTVQYRWWVNDQEVENLNAPTLPPGNFRPRDWLFCIARLMDENDQVMQTLHSNRITVLAQPPRTNLDPVPSFTVPGEFRYQIRAVDPNEPEGSGSRTLSYELVEPQSENIVIDRDSGLITWMIDTETAKQLAESSQTITFKVLSSWGTGITSSITLNLNRQESGQE